MKPLSIVLILVLAAALGGGGYYFYSTQYGDQTSTTPTAPSSTPVPLTPTTPSPTGPLTTKETGVQEIKSAHFEDSSPAHNEVYVAAPMNVTVNFNFDLATNSTMAIEKDNVDYGTGETIVDPNKRTLRRKMKAAPDGIYTVKHKACWPDKTCHDGLHAFTIDSKQLTKYLDMTGKSEVNVEMENTAFTPRYIVISRGTKVTWDNHDAVTHYVNADSHPAHTFVLALNSEALGKGQEFSYTFTDPGESPYHCSAHAAQMTARIVVK